MCSESDAARAKLLRQREEAPESAERDRRRADGYHGSGGAENSRAQSDCPEQTSNRANPRKERTQVPAVAPEAHTGMQESVLQPVEATEGQVKVEDDSANGEHMIQGRCTKCGTTRTPQWREGPEGPKTLCNACGVRLSREKKTKWGKATRRRKTSQKSPSCPHNTGYRHNPSRDAGPRGRVRSADVALIQQLHNFPSAEVEGGSTGDADTDASESLSQEFNAAVQLLSMSIHSRGQKRKRDGGQGTQREKVEFISGRPEWHSGPSDQIIMSWSRLPEWKKTELWPMRSQVQTAWFQVEAAEAAVTAVGEVLAARTAAAVEAQLRFKSLTKMWEKACSSMEADEGRAPKREKTEHSVQDVA